jgi:DNA-binding protein YbaB
MTSDINPSNLPSADDNELLKELEKSLASGDSSALMKDLEQNMQKMKDDLETTFKGLDEEIFKGQSSDKSFSIEMSGTYNLKDIDFGKQALQGGVTEFKWRIREAWKNLMEQIQEATQKKTMDLLGSMNLPPELQGMAGQPPKDEESEG